MIYFCTMRENERRKNNNFKEKKKKNSVDLKNEKITSFELLGKES